MGLEFQNNPSPSLLMVEGDPEALPDADPSAGQRRLAVGTDHLLYLVSDSGVKTLVGGAGIANPLATDSLWDAAGDLVQGSGANTAAKLSAGTAGKVLTSNGAAAALTWETPAGGGAVATDAIWDAAGDLAVGTGANTGAKLTVGSSGQVPKSNGTTLVYAHPLEFAPVFANVATSETTTSTSGADLTTPGPSVTVTVGASGIVKLTFGCTLNNNGANDTRVGVVISGANTVAYSTKMQITSTTAVQMSRVIVLSGLSTGSTTFKMQYAVAAGTGTYVNRVIIAEPCV